MSSVHAHVARRSPAARAAASTEEASRPRPDGVVRGTLRLITDTWRKADRDRILGLAGENAFMGVLTLFPTLLVFAAVLGQLESVIGSDDTRDVKRAISSFLTRVLTRNANGVDDTVRKLFDTPGRTLTVALVIALASVAQAFASVINTISVAYELHDRRGWWHRRFLGLLIGLGSLIAGAMLLTAFVVGPLLGHSGDIVSKIGLSRDYSFLWAWIRFPVGFVALVAWATTLFHLCPDRPSRWRSGWPGGLLTSLLWIAASLGFSSYLALVVPRSPVLGALGGGILLMTWFYLLFLSLLAGAELNATLLVRSRVATGHRVEDGPLEHGSGELGVEDEDTDHL